MRDARMVSVRRGANSLNPQSNSLGGELDVLSYTGRNEQGRLRYGTAPMVAKGYKRHLVAFLTMVFDGRVNFTYDHLMAIANTLLLNVKRYAATLVM